MSIFGIPYPLMPWGVFLVVAVFVITVELIARKRRKRGTTEDGRIEN